MGFATAFVLAAGHGTRLRPLTHHRPKPLMPVCGVPLIAYSLALCAKHGHHQVIVNAHAMPDPMSGWAGPREGVQVIISHEQPSILGTGGGLKHVEHKLARTVAVLNGDVLCDVDLTRLVQAVPAGGAAMALRNHPSDAERYGIIATDSEQVVVDLKQLATATAVGAVRRTSHFTGIHAMDRSMLRHVPHAFACIVRTAYLAEVPHRRVVGVNHPGVWLDIGNPRVYLRANLAVLTGQLSLPLNPFERAGWARSGSGRCYGNPHLVQRAELHGPCWIGHGAQLGRCRLTRCIIGNNAVVPDGTDLTDCVVWDSCQLTTATHTGAIGFDGGVMTPGRVNAN